MNWKFWEKTPKEKTETKLPKPTEIHEALGRYLITKLLYDPDYIWSLKLVSILKEGTKNTYYFRTYDTKTSLERGLHIKNYRDLDSALDLVLFDGWYHKKTWDMEIHDLCKEKKSA